MSRILGMCNCALMALWLLEVWTSATSSGSARVVEWITTGAVAVIAMTTVFAALVGLDAIVRIDSALIAALFAMGIATGWLNASWVNYAIVAVGACALGLSFRHQRSEASTQPLSGKTE